MHPNLIHQERPQSDCPPLSALLITYNEERNIKDFLENISFADEIIVVDAYSTDKTVEIARTFPKIQIYQRRFDDFPSQKNYVLNLAAHEWILFCDADERLNENLKEEIFQTISQQDAHDAYHINIRFYFMNKILFYSGFQNDKSIRLFKKTCCRYDPHRHVHEIVSYEGTVGKLKNPLAHYTYASWDQYNQKLVRYAHLQSEELFAKGVRPNAFHFFFKPWYRFFDHYILKLGILDGWEGFFISCLCAFYVFRRYVFLWMKYRGIH
ncbi:MAG: glycosyltransferase family 2 protein [Flavobacteriales bacterium]